jgi:hypothetical protein
MLADTANGCLMLVICVPVLFVTIIALDAANWPCRILMGLTLAVIIFSPRPETRPPLTITYLPQASAHEPLISLQPGQIVTVPWPHTLQVHLPEGVHLQVIEASPERIRVMAVSSKQPAHPDIHPRKSEWQKENALS